MVVDNYNCTDDRIDSNIAEDDQNLNAGRMTTITTTTTATTAIMTSYGDRDENPTAILRVHPLLTTLTILMTTASAMTTTPRTTTYDDRDDNCTIRVKQY